MIVLDRVYWLVSQSVDVTVLQLVSTDVALTGVVGAVWLVFTGRLLGYPRRSGGMWIVLGTMSK